MLDADLDMQVGLLPALRGKLATPSETDGRFEMPLLCVADGSGDVDVEDVDAAAEAFSAGHTRVSIGGCLLYTSPSPRDLSTSRMPSSA